MKILKLSALVWKVPSSPVHSNKPMAATATSMACELLKPVYILITSILPDAGFSVATGPMARIGAGRGGTCGALKESSTSCLWEAVF